MKTYNQSFQELNQKERKEPRHILEIYGDSHTYYILSNDDIIISGVDPSYIIKSSFIKSSVKSQTLQSINATSTLGAMSFEVLDTNSELTSLLASIESLSESLRARKIIYYYGYKGGIFTPGTGGDYVQLQTQIIHDNLSPDGVSYKINTRDIPRSLIQKIFTRKQTTLMSSISRSAIAVPVKLVTDFGMITHTASFSDAPNETVGYFRIEDEIFRWTAKNPSTDIFTIDNESSTLNGATTVNATTLAVNDITNFATLGLGFIDDGANISEIKWIGITAASPGPGGTLTGVTGIKYAHASGSTIVYSKGRGLFNTIAVAHEVDSSITDDDRKPKITEWIYLEMPALQMALTVMTGTIYGTANTIPSHWTPSVSTEWIATSIFENIGTDIYDPSDDTGGFILRFDGLNEWEAMTWLQQQIYRPCLVFDYVRADGQIAVKRINESLPDSPYIRKLDDSQHIKFINFIVDFNDVYNEFEILWNWNGVTESFTRRLLLSDDDSKTQEKIARRLTIELYGLHGSRHTNAIIIQWLDSWRSRNARAPWKGTIQIKSLNIDLELADQILVDSDYFKDYLGSDPTRFSRTMEIRKVTFDSNNAKLNIDVFGSIHRATPLNLGSQSAVLNSSSYTGAGTDLSTETTYFTDISGVLHADFNGYTLVGQSSINNVAARYFVDGDFTLDYGVGITFTQNTLLLINGYFTCNGFLTGAGQGIPGIPYSGASPPTTSKGTVSAGTAGFFGITEGGGGIKFYAGQATNTPAPAAIGNNANPPRLNIINNAGNLEINQDDLRPSSGGAGFYSQIGSYIAAGGDGGAGGAVLVIVCKGMTFGINGYIDVSGEAGTQGETAYDYSGGDSSIKVIGGAGASGSNGAVWVLLDGNTVDQPSNKLIAYYQSTENPGTPVPNGNIPLTEFNKYGYPLNSSVYFHKAENRNQSSWIVQRIPDNVDAVIDAPKIAQTSSLISVNPITDSINTINTEILEITTTAPSDTNWKADAIYYQLQGAADWTRLGTTNGSNELKLYIGTNSGTLNFKAHPISLSNIESPDYIERTYTVPASTTTKLSSNNLFLIGSATDYLVGNGISMKDDSGVAKMHCGNPSGVYWHWDGSAMDFINASTIYGTYPSGNYVLIDSDGIYGYSSSLGQTFGLYTDGTPPVLKQGTIDSDVKQNNTNALYSDSIFINNIASMLIAEVSTTSSNWTAADHSYGRTIGNITSETGTYYAETIDRSYDRTAYSWAKNRYIGAIIHSGGLTGGQFSFATGFYQFNSGSDKIRRHFGFINKDVSGTRHWYATWADGTTEGTSDLGAVSGSDQEIVAIYTPGTGIDFYIDGSLIYTASTLLPTGTADAEFAVHYAGEKLTTSGIVFTIGEITMHQSP